MKINSYLKVATIVVIVFTIGIQGNILHNQSNTLKRQESRLDSLYKVNDNLTHTVSTTVNQSEIKSKDKSPRHPQTFDVTAEKVNMLYAQAFINNNSVKFAQIPIGSAKVLIAKYDMAEKLLRQVNTKDTIKLSDESTYKVESVTTMTHDSDSEIKKIKDCSKDQLVVILGTEEGIVDNVVIANTI